MKKNILFIAPSLHGGGAERVITTLLNNINTEKFTFSLALINNEGPLIDELSKKIDIIDLKAVRVRYASLKLLKLIWYKKPDIIFSTLGHLNLLVIVTKLFMPKQIKYICRETNIPSLVHKRKIKYYIFLLLYRSLYKFFDHVVCQSTDMRKDLIEHYNIPLSKLSLINNPCDIKRIQNKISKSKKDIYFSSEKINLLSVGALTNQKGFDLLINAISKIKDNRFHLTIIGEGPEKQILKDLVDKLNISNKINFVGFKNNPYTYMHHADLFILSSRYEGFPNVVLESLACGTAVVAYDSPGDLNKIVYDGINGFLVKYLSIDDLAKTIVKASKTKFDLMDVQNSVIDRYSINKIIPQYENLFLTTH